MRAYLPGFLFIRKMTSVTIAGAELYVKGTVEYRRRHLFADEDMPRKALDMKFTDYPGVRQQALLAGLPSGEDGSGQRPEIKLTKRDALAAGMRFSKGIPKSGL